MKYTILITLTLISGCYSREPISTDLQGKSMPSFKFLLADRMTWFDTKDIPKGQPIVLFYYSPRCPYCHAQTKEIIEKIDKLKDIKIYLVTSFPMLEIKQFYKQYNLSKYTNIISVRDTSHLFSNYFEVEGVPYMAIYGKDKRLNDAFIGKIYGSQIKKAAFK